MGNHEKRLVSVCIASIGRPSLLDTISGVKGCVLPPNFQMEIVIADDSPDGAVTMLFASDGKNSNYCQYLKIVTSATQNISLARNLCMTHARGEYIVFIDDDEVPSCEWLACLVNRADSSDADAVQGNVSGIYSSDSPSWALRLRPFDKSYGEAGKHILFGSTANLLLRRSSLSIRSLQFSADFGKSGGEDTELTYRLTYSGGVIVCSPEALVYENVPRERLSLHYLVRRYVRVGHTYASVILARQDRLCKSLEFCKACMLTVIFLLLAVVFALVQPSTSMRYMIRFSKNIGKLFFFLGLPIWNLY